MHGTLSSYIQINVYGRKLQEIERSGFDMTKLLNKIGCEKFWIGEVPLYNLVEFSASDSSLADDYGENEKEAVETDAPPDLYRNSLADIKFPPCSTPRYSKRYPSFKIPPGISVIKSMENFENNADLSSNESGGVCIKDCVLDVLQNLLQEVELAISHDDAVLRADTISNSSSKRAINNLKRRTCSRIEDLPTTLSKQQKTIENSPTTNSEDFVSHREIKMEVGITKEVASSPLLTTNLPNLLTDRLESPNVSKQRSERIFSELNPVIHYNDSEKTNLYHTADNLSENQPEHSKWETFEEKLYESPDYYDHGCSMTHEEGHVGRDQEDTVLLENCEGGETEKIIDNAEHLENNVVMNDVEDVYGKNIDRTPYFDNNVTQDHQVQDISFEMDNGSYGNGERNEDDYYSISDNDDTEIMVLENEGDIRHSPPPQNMSEVKSILRSSMQNYQSTILKKKTVSFVIPKEKMTEKQKRLNETYQLKCYYEGCGKVLAWKIRYGRQRLVEHAVLHCKEKCIVCRKCHYGCSTSRQMQYHYKKNHPDVKCEKFKIFELLNMEINDATVTDLVDECFGAHSSIVGPIRKLRKRRNLKINGQSTAQENNLINQDDRDQSNEFFYFRRIR